MEIHSAFTKPFVLTFLMHEADSNFYTYPHGLLPTHYVYKL